VDWFYNRRHHSRLHDGPGLTNAGATSANRDFARTTPVAPSARRAALSAVNNAPPSWKHWTALKQTSSDGAQCSPSCGQCVPGPADAAFRIGNQRAISAFTKRPNFAGVRSLLGGIDPPSSATFALTLGSSRDWLSAAASLSTMGFGVPFGAKILAQMPSERSSR
jgi:hypothetical protein